MMGQLGEPMEFGAEAIAFKKRYTCPPEVREFVRRAVKALQDQQAGTSMLIPASRFEERLGLIKIDIIPTLMSCREAGHLAINSTDDEIVITKLK